MGRTRAEILPTLPRHVVGVAAVIVDEEERVLVIKRRDEDVWEFPGGALEIGETVVDGLVREVSEETGLDVTPQRLTGVYQNMTLGPVALLFRCRRVGGTERLSAETREWRWASLDEVRALMPDAWSTRAADALNETAPPVRMHDGTTVLTSVPER